MSNLTSHCSDAQTDRPTQHQQYSCTQTRLHTARALSTGSRYTSTRVPVCHRTAALHPSGSARQRQEHETRPTTRATDSPQRAQEASRAERDAYGVRGLAESRRRTCRHSILPRHSPLPSTPLHRQDTREIHTARTECTQRRRSPCRPVRSPQHSTSSAARAFLPQHTHDIDNGCSVMAGQASLSVPNRIGIHKKHTEAR